jgi:hypothetical protein
LSPLAVNHVTLIVALRSSVLSAVILESEVTIALSEKPILKFLSSAVAPKVPLIF